MPGLSTPLTPPPFTEPPSADPGAESSATHGSPVVHQAITALRKRILAAHDNDEFLGNEKALIAELGISRPTFRQAARLLEHELLLRIKRGNGGGFYAQPHSSRMLSRMAAIQLNACGTSVQQISDAMEPVFEQAAVLLSTTADRSARERLAACRDEAAALAFETTVGDLCGNPVIALMLHVMRDLIDAADGATPALPCEPGRTRAEFQRELVAAILAGDAEMARLLIRRHGMRIHPPAQAGAGAGPGRPAAV